MRRSNPRDIASLIRPSANRQIDEEDVEWAASAIRSNVRVVINDEFATVLNETIEQRVREHVGLFVRSW